MCVYERHSPQTVKRPFAEKGAGEWEIHKHTHIHVRKQNVGEWNKDFRVPHLRSVWPWASHLISLSLSLTLCKIKTNSANFVRWMWGLDAIIGTKLLIHSMCSVNEGFLSYVVSRDSGKAQASSNPVGRAGRVLQRKAEPCLTPRGCLLCWVTRWEAEMFLDKGECDRDEEH